MADHKTAIRFSGSYHDSVIVNDVYAFVVKLSLRVAAA